MESAAAGRRRRGEEPALPAAQPAGLRGGCRVGGCGWCQGRRQGAGGLKGGVAQAEEGRALGGLEERRKGGGLKGRLGEGPSAGAVGRFEARPREAGPKGGVAVLGRGPRHAHHVAPVQLGEAEGPGRRRFLRGAVHPHAPAHRLGRPAAAPTTAAGAAGAAAAAAAAGAASDGAEGYALEVNPKAQAVRLRVRGSERRARRASGRVGGRGREQAIHMAGWVSG